MYLCCIIHFLLIKRNGEMTGQVAYVLPILDYMAEMYSTDSFGGFIKGILRGVRCTKSLRVLFLHRRPPSWTTLVLYSRAVFFFNEPASSLSHINSERVIQSHLYIPSMKGSIQRGLIYIENKPLGHLCKMCNPFILS
jgi:hypothetical protein